MERNAYLARRPLAEGEVLTLDILQPKPLNQDGDIVQLVVSSDNLIVRSKGKIMSNAMLNAKVKVLSLATNTVVDGVLVSKGIVEIDGGMP